jgi:3-deoxy-D-manno-octulosonic-acid transferase
MNWAETLYRGTAAAALAAGVPRWILRDRPDELAERLGRIDGPCGALWLHAASVGELGAAGPLLRRLRVEGTGPVMLSVMTRTGLRAAGSLPLDSPPFHPPLDAPAAVARALDRLRPTAWIALETELWPTLVRALSRRAVPAAIASARLSRRGFARMRGAGSLYRPVVRLLSAVAARTEEDAERYVALGAPVECVRVTGDLKEDRPVPERVPPPAGPRWIAACTRPGEEHDVLAALETIERRVPRGELVLAPRHPERFDEVASLVTASGRPLRRWSAADGSRFDAPADGDGWRVLLVDELGVLDEAYRASSVAFVGGSLRRFRGHSPWEAARVGRPVLMGPDTSNCADAFARLEARGGAVRVADAADLAARVADWLADPAAADAAGVAAHDVVRGGLGAGERTVAFLRERGVVA